jgi:hypothetical protein
MRELALAEITHADGCVVPCQLNTSRMLLRAGDLADDQGPVELSTYVHIRAEAVHLAPIVRKRLAENRYLRTPR